MLDSHVKTWVSRVVTSWRQGSKPSAVAALKAHPELREQESVVMDLALAEYRLRRAAGEVIEATRFCEQFSTYRDELRKILSVERGLPAFDEPAWPVAGETFLEFELLRLLGKGAASHVFLARQTTIGDRPVALKITPYGSGEAHTLGKLPHDHIVPVLSVHYDDDTGLSAVCMPYLGSATLQDVVQRVWATLPEPGRRHHPDADAVLAAAAEGSQEPIAPPSRLGNSYWLTVARLGAELAQGLAFTHSRGILHHDLKPSNVLLTPDGRPMLLDFNLAWDPHHTSARLGGTLPYMAPEQFLVTFVTTDSSGPSADPRSDVYSLGAILFQLCTGRLPHGVPPANMAECVKYFGRAHLAGAPTVRSVQPAVPRDLARTIDRCLQTAVADRPASADELAAELERVVRRALRRRRVRQYVAVSGTVAALLTAAAVTAAPHLASAPDPEPASVAHAEATATFDQHLAKARVHLHSANFESAARELTQALRMQDDPEIRRHLVYCLYKQNDLSPALSHARQLAQQFPEDGKIANNLGRCAFRTGNFGLAKYHLDVAMRLEPESFIPCHNRALFNLRAPADLRDGDAGIGFIERAIELAPDQYLLHISAAAVYDAALENETRLSIDLAVGLRAHVERAVELGCTRQMLAAQPFARRLAETSWFETALARAKPGEALPLRDDFVFFIPDEGQLSSVGRLTASVASTQR